MPKDVEPKLCGVEACTKAQAEAIEEVGSRNWIAGRKNGRDAGLLEAAVLVEERAAALWLSGTDSRKAEALRELAGEIREKVGP